MEIDYAVFQDLECFGKREVISKWLWKGFRFLAGEVLKYPEMDIT